MPKYTKPHYDYKTLGKNPCITPLSIPVHEIPFKNQYKMVDGVLINIIAEAEKTPFTRIYITPEHRKLIAGLTPSAKELFMWIMYEVNSNEDALWINKERFMEENHTSLNTYKNALKELIRLALIAISVVPGVYWINPEFFFRGNRVEKYPEKVVKK